MNGDLRRWAEAIAQSVEALRRVTYDPSDGRHVVRPPSQERPTVEAGLAELYAVCDGLSLPDMYVGYFIDPAERVATAASRGAPVRVDNGAPFEVAVFGSDGGGGLFALRRDDAAVYHLAPGAIRGGTYVPFPRTAPARIAESISGFLWALVDDVQAFVAGDAKHDFLVDRWEVRS